MKIGIISDSHDRIDNLNKALEIFIKNKVSEIIHCGDFCAPFMIQEMAKFKGKIHCIFGNINDEYTSTKFAIENGVNLYGDFAELEIDRKKIAVVHFPQIARSLALSGKYDAVFYGHDHIKNFEKVNNTFLVNPGELMGRKAKPSCAIYNTEENSIKHIDIK